MPPRLVHGFVCQAALPAGGSQEVVELVLGRLMPRLCGQGESIGLLWHTLHGLLNGPSAGDEVPLGAPAAVELVRGLLADEAFVALAVEELAAACGQLAARWSLPWQLEAPTEEACVAVGLDAAALGALAATWERPPAAAAAGVAAPAEAAAADEDADAVAVAIAAVALDSDEAVCAWTSGAEGPYEEMVQALLALTSAPRGDAALPPVLCAGVLSVSVALVDALHRLRFGDVARGEALKRRPDDAAQAASRACLLVDQVRLCSNVLYGNRCAQDFARLTRGLQVLLSHCYSDAEVPLLREAGVFAVRNSTCENKENQEAIRQILAERKAAIAAAGPEVALESPPIEEFGFGI